MQYSEDQIKRLVYALNALDALGPERELWIYPRHDAPDELICINRQGGARLPVPITTAVDFLKLYGDERSAAARLDNARLRHALRLSDEAMEILGEVDWTEREENEGI